MVLLVPLTEIAFQKYLAFDIQRYANEKVKAGHWRSTDALEKSRREHDRLLPAGLTTKNHYFCSIKDAKTNSKVGILWFAVPAKRQSAFIYDFLIDEKFRGKGYGKQTLQAFEDTMKQMGVKKISLHVFAHNHAARALYEKLGYKGIGTTLSKQLG